MQKTSDINKEKIIGRAFVELVSCVSSELEPAAYELVSYVAQVDMNRAKENIPSKKAQGASGKREVI